MPKSRALVVALWAAVLPPLVGAQTLEPSSPAQKRPAQPGVQAGPTAGASAPGAASAASASQAEKKPAKPGVQSGPTPSSKGS